MKSVNFDKIIARLEKLFSGKVQAKVGEIAVKHFDDSFENKGFTDKKFSPWKPVIDPKTKKEKERPLVRSGAMRRGIRQQRSGKGITIYNDVDYAGYHNEGGSTPGRPPKRQFIGDSADLDKKIEAMIMDELNNIFL